MDLRVPGKTTSLVLGALALFFVAFPIVCVPSAISGLIATRSARRFIRVNGMKSDNAVQIGQILNLSALTLTLIIMVFAIPGAIERNFG